MIGSLAPMPFTAEALSRTPRRRAELAVRPASASSGGVRVAG
jgi:hypothetical protein